MRRALATTIATLAVLAVSGVATAAAPAAAAPAKKPPVQLQGKVIDKGTKTVKGKSIAVEQNDFYFKPTFIKAKRGSTLTIEVKNQGSNQHTFTIDTLNIDKVLNPGKKAKVKVDVPSSGAFNFYCRFHRSSGMQGAIFTKKGDTVVAGTGTGATPTSGSTGATGSTATTTTGSTGAPPTTHGSGGGSTSTTRSGYGY